MQVGAIMAVTAQKIAELAGVSRGTVDRALHNRSRVNPEVAARIRKIADELDEQGIPVVTLNSDVPGSRRLCFVGQNCYRAGQTAYRTAARCCR